ncbi:DUF397 domain-containing protein [Thermopolyspora sp. NPDC052614]|uniref:DUF397 domain-containing protein n=1 Tax=Thermopolyspora sp. NPDC052614 TaxID=3155682 RepID=UPI003433AE25
MRWRKSSYSGDTGNCVEAARFPSGRIGIRDSKNPTGPTLLISYHTWRQFIVEVRADEMA